jgi:hypothetical protein
MCEFFGDYSNSEISVGLDGLKPRQDVAARSVQHEVTHSKLNSGSAGGEAPLCPAATV